MKEIRLLIVDDETDYTSPLSKRLTRRGLRVVTASSGFEALQTLKSTEIDIILLDIKMADMDGVKTLGEIKRLYPHIEVVMLTAHANTDTVISSIAMGAFDYLMKPVSVDDLVQKIGDAYLQRKKNLD
ncbi:MAG: response regulator [Desulfovibrio sp.]